MTLLDPRSAGTTGVSLVESDLAGWAARVDWLCSTVPGAPVTATWPWLSASVLKPAEGQRASMLAVEDGDELVAAALLLETDGLVTLAGTAEHHRGALLAASEPAAYALGSALAELLRDRAFSLGPVLPGPAVSALLSGLPFASVAVDEVAIPYVLAAPGVPSGMSHGTARTLRKAANRLAADGVTATVEVTGAAAEIRAKLPLLARIYRDRDVAAGRASAIDDPARHALWARRVKALSSLGALRLATLTLDGDLAAYVLGIEDGGAYRILEGRYVAAFARYAPGRVLENAVLEQVTSSGAQTVLDWMTPVAPETLLAANGAESLVVVRSA